MSEPFLITEMLRALHPVYDMIAQRGETCMLPKIELGDQQLMVIEDFYKWYKACDPDKAETMIYKMSGYAGTGKTTVIPFMQFRIGSYNWVFATLTGKAAGVLRTKGLNANTIHSSLYKYTEDISIAEPGLKRHIGALEDLKLTTDDRELLFIIEHSIKEKKALLDDIYTKNPKNKSWYVLNPESSFFSADVICIDEASMIDKIMEVDILLAGKPIFYCGDNGQLI